MRAKRHNQLRKPFVTTTLCALCLSLSTFPQKTKVACIGDSITEGNAKKNEKRGVTVTQGGWVALLRKELGEGFNVQNFGREGQQTTVYDTANDRTYHVTREFQRMALFGADISIVMFGTNDANPKKHENCCWDRFIPDYEALLDTIRVLSPNTQILLVRPIPIFENEYGHENTTLIEQVIPRIDTIAQKRKYPLIDCYTPMKDLSSMVPDGVHPDDAGMQVIMRTIHQEIIKTSGIRFPQGKPIHQLRIGPVNTGNGVLRIPEYGVDFWVEISESLLGSPRSDS